MGFDVFVGLQSGAGHDSRSGTWIFLVYSGVCQPLELDSWNSPKGIRTKILLEGMAEPIWMWEACNDAYPPVFPEFLWNWGIGRTHCWWLSAALNEQRLYQNLLLLHCLKYIRKEQWTRPCFFIVRRGGVLPRYIYIYVFIYLYINIYIYISIYIYWKSLLPLAWMECGYPASILQK